MTENKFEFKRWGILGYFTWERLITWAIFVGVFAIHAFMTNNAIRAGDEEVRREIAEHTKATEKLQRAVEKCLANAKLTTP